MSEIISQGYELATIINNNPKLLTEAFLYLDKEVVDKIVISALETKTAEYRLTQVTENMDDSLIARGNDTMECVRNIMEYYSKVCKVKPKEVYKEDIDPKLKGKKRIEAQEQADIRYKEEEKKASEAARLQSEDNRRLLIKDFNSMLSDCGVYKDMLTHMLADEDIELGLESLESILSKVGIEPTNYNIYTDNLMESDIPDTELKEFRLLGHKAKGFFYDGILFIHIEKLNKYYTTSNV